jgi:type III restriction enzyme
MKLQFDPNQPYQRDAVAAVVDLFDGQPQGTPEYAVIHTEDYGSLFAGQARTELGVGNRLLLAEDGLGRHFVQKVTEWHTRKIKDLRQPF